MGDHWCCSFCGLFEGMISSNFSGPVFGLPLKEEEKEGERGQGLCSHDHPSLKLANKSPMQLIIFRLVYFYNVEYITALTRYCKEKNGSPLISRDEVDRNSTSVLSRRIIERVWAIVRASPTKTPISDFLCPTAHVDSTLLWFSPFKCAKYGYFTFLLCKDGSKYK